MIPVIGINPVNPKNAILIIEVIAINPVATN